MWRDKKDESEKEEEKPNQTGTEEASGTEAPAPAPVAIDPSSNEGKAQALFLEGTAQLRGGTSVSKAVKTLTEARALDPENIEIAGALWEAERELAAVLHEMASSLKAEGREAEAGKSEMRAKLAEERAAKLDSMSVNSRWRTERSSSADVEVPDEKVRRWPDHLCPALCGDRRWPRVPSPAPPPPRRPGTTRLR